MTRLLTILSLIVLSAMANSQEAANIKGSCNGTAVGTNLRVTVTCNSSLSKEQAGRLANQYARILQKIQEDHISYDLVIQKLDSIQSGVDDLRSATAPRRLSDKQIEKLSTLRAELAPDSITIVHLMSDQESTLYARQFADGLHLSGAHTMPIGMTMPPLIGVNIAIPSAFLSARKVPRSCEVLKAFLDSEKIPYTMGGRQIYGDGEGQVPAECELQIGSKPVY